jgi:hypothetical protein
MPSAAARRREQRLASLPGYQVIEQKSNGRLVIDAPGSEGNGTSDTIPQFFPVFRRQ